MKYKIGLCLVCLVCLLAPRLYSEDLKVVDIYSGALDLQKIQDVYIHQATNRVYVLGARVNTAAILAIYDINADGNLNKLVETELNLSIERDQENNLTVSKDGTRIYVSTFRRGVFFVSWDKKENTLKEHEIGRGYGATDGCDCEAILSLDERFLYFAVDTNVVIIALNRDGSFNHEQSRDHVRDIDDTGVYIKDLGMSSDGSVLHVMRQQELSSYKIDSADGSLHEFSELRIFPSVNLHGEFLKDLIMDDKSEGFFMIIETEPQNENLDFVKYLRMEFNSISNKYEPVAEHLQNFLPGSKPGFENNNFVQFSYTFKDPFTGLVIEPAKIELLSYSNNDKVFQKINTYYFDVEFLTSEGVFTAEAELFNDNIYFSPDIYNKGLQKLTVENNQIVNDKLLYEHTVTETPRFDVTSISPNDKYLAVLHDRAYLVIYERDLNTGNLKKRFWINEFKNYKEIGNGEQIIFSGDSRFIITWFNGEIRSYYLNEDTNNLDLVSQLQFTGATKNFAVSSIGDLLLSFGDKSISYSISDSGVLTQINTLEHNIDARNSILFNNDTFVYVLANSGSVEDTIGAQLVLYSIDLGGALKFENSVELVGSNITAFEISKLEDKLYYESNNNIYISDLDPTNGNLSNTKIIGEYYNNSGSIALNGLQELEVLEGDTRAIFYFSNKIVEINLENMNEIKSEPLDYYNDEGLYWLALSNDGRFGYYSKFLSRNVYKLSRKLSSESVVSANVDSKTFDIALGEQSFSIANDFQSSAPLIFSAKNLPPGLSIDKQGTIFGDLKRVELSSRLSEGEIIATTGINNASFQSNFRIILDNSTPFGKSEVLNIDESLSLTSNLTAKDDDNDKLTVEIIKYPQHGRFSLKNTNLGTFEYVANFDFSGEDYLEYTVSDPFDTSEVYKVTFNVDSSNSRPVAENDSFDIVFKTTTVLSVLNNDSDSDGALDKSSIKITTEPTLGSIAILGNGELEYTPFGSTISGEDNFEYTVNDDKGAVSNAAQVSLNLLANKAPVANDDSVTTEFETKVEISILDNDSDDDGGIDSTTVGLTLSPSNGEFQILSDGKIEYTPNNGFSGTDTFKYVVLDSYSSQSNEATVTITVKAQSTTPAPAPTPTPPPSGDGGGGGSTSLLLMLMMLAYAGRRHYR